MRWWRTSATSAARRAGRSADPARRQGRCLRPRRGRGRPDPRGRWRRRPLRRDARRGVRPARGRDRGRRSSSCTRCRRRGPRRSPEPGITVSAGDPRLLAALLAAHAAASTGATLRHRDSRSRPGWAAAASTRPGSSTLSGVPSTRPRRREVVGMWTHLQAPEDREIARRGSSPGSMGPPRPCAPPGIATARPPRDRQQRARLGRDRRVRRRAARAWPSTDCCPTSSTRTSATPRWRGRCGPSSSLHARPVRVADLPVGWGASATGRRS